MALALKIIDSPKGETVTKWNVVMPPEGGTIGRKTNSTMVLNDTKRVVSGLHAQISVGDAGYRITDLSTNGLFLNHSATPLGKNKSVGLNDGDVLTIGGYTLLVSIDTVAKKAEQAKTKETLEEVFDPFASAETKVGSEQSASPTNSTNSFGFPDPFGDDPFAKVEQKPKSKETDVFITNNNYDYTKSMDKTIDLSPKDDILDEEMSYTISPDPFADTSTNDNVVKPSTSIPLAMDKKNMFGGNPFNSANELIDTPLGDISEVSSNNFISMNIALRKQQKNMEEAIIMAFNRFLQEIEPEHFEDIFGVFNKSKLFFLKPKYWNSYKEFFELNRSNNEWQNKFIMYFRESLDIVRNKNNNGDN